MTLVPVAAVSKGNVRIDITTGNQFSLASLLAATGSSADADILVYVTGDVGGPIVQDIDTTFEVRIVVDGSVHGYGGDGDHADDFDNTDEPGGTAIEVQFPCVIVNNGTLAGGGNGGAASEGSGNGGGGGGAGRPYGSGGRGSGAGNDGADGGSISGGAGGSGVITGGDGGDLGSSPAITGYADVTYSGSGSLLGGTD